jgi:tetratricopeptide (TPR) repeat protein
MAIKTRNLKYYLAGLVSLITLVIYFSALQNGFVSWDDDIYIYENPHISSINIAFFKWAFFDFYASNWHPLTWISHALDYAVWGLNPLGHHLTNNILHAFNTFIVVLLTFRLVEIHQERTIAEGMTTFLDDRRTLIAAGITGALFGLHPVHVESVAWVAERKDLLCALFFLLSVMAYAKYVKGEARETIQNSSSSYFSDKQYLLSLGFFLLALLGKPMAVSLPAVLLILDWYPFKRIQSGRIFRTAFIEKLPFFVLSLISSVLTILAQQTGESLVSVKAIPLSSRALVAIKSLMTYLWKMILPLNLLPLYPYPQRVSLVAVEYFLPIVLAIGITVLCVRNAGKQKLWLSAWGYFVITLIPVLGIVQVGIQSMADRYTYLPSLGPFILLALSVAWVLRQASSSQREGLMVKLASTTISIIVLASLSWLTFQQIGVWKNSIGLWNYVINNSSERIPRAYYNRGVIFDKMGQFERALADYDTAITLDPSYYKVYNNRGIVLKKMGLHDAALKDFDRLLALRSSDYNAYFNRGLVFEQKEEFDKALADFDKAISINPRADTAYLGRGIIYAKVGRFNKAVEDFSEAISLNPNDHKAYFDRGYVYSLSGEKDKALDDFSKAIEINKNFSMAFFNRGNLYLAMGNKELAALDFRRACDLGDREACVKAEGSR